MDNILFDKKRLFIILGFLFLLFSLPIAILLVQRQQRYTGRAAYANEPPKSVHVTNVYSKGFTLSWVTNTETTGKIKMCGNDINCGTSQPFQDIRGETSATKTHYVNVTVTNPSVSYYFRILSGDSGDFGVNPTTSSELEVYDDNNVVSPGASFKVSTLASIGNEDDAANNPPGAYSMENPLSGVNKYASFLPCPDGTDVLPTKACFRPNPIYGEVLMPDGSTKASGTIIYMYVKSGANVVSRMLSTLAESTSALQGRWTMDMANFYNKNGSYLGYTPGGDTLTISAEGAPNLKVEKEGFGIPEVIDDSCIADVLNCAKAPTAPAGVNPVSLTLESVAVPTPTSGVTPTGGITPTEGVTPTTPPSLNKRDVSGPTPGVPDNKVDSSDAGYVLRSPYPCGSGGVYPTCQY